MPTTGRHSSIRSNRHSEASENQLYPNLSGMDIEMSNLNEERVSTSAYMLCVTNLNKLLDK